MYTSSPVVIGGDLQTDSYRGININIPDITYSQTLSRILEAVSSPQPQSPSFRTVSPSCLTLSDMASPSSTRVASPVHSVSDSAFSPPPPYTSFSLSSPSSPRPRSEPEPEPEPELEPEPAAETSNERRRTRPSRLATLKSKSYQDQSLISEIDSFFNPKKKRRASDIDEPDTTNRKRKKLAPKFKSKRTGEHRCPICGESLSRGADVTRHLKYASIHNPNSQELPGCEVCGKKFRPDALKRHKDSVVCTALDVFVN